MSTEMGALIAALLSDAGASQNSDLHVVLSSRPIARSCAVESTATIVAYDALAAHEIVYRFVHSDGSRSPIGRVDLAGTGAVAQSVRDRWTPRGAAWVALEIVAPHHLRTPHLALATRCSRRDDVATR